MHYAELDTSRRCPRVDPPAGGWEPLGRDAGHGWEPARPAREAPGTFEAATKCEMIDNACSRAAIHISRHCRCRCAGLGHRLREQPQISRRRHVAFHANSSTLL